MIDENKLAAKVKIFLFDGYTKSVFFRQDGEKMVLFLRKTAVFCVIMLKNRAIFGWDGLFLRGIIEKTTFVNFDKNR